MSGALVHLEPRLLALAGGVSSAVLAAVLFLMRRGFPDTIRGLGQWAWGATAGFAGALLLAGRGAVPDLLSIVVGDSMVAAGYLLFYAGTRLFYGLPAPRRLWSASLALAGLAFAWFTYAVPDYDARVLVFAAFVCSVNLAHAQVALERETLTTGSRMLAGVLIADVVLIVVRAALSATGATGELFSPDVIQALYLGTFTAFSAVLTIGLVVLSTERLRQDLEFLATHDFLTGALSRRALFDFGERVVSACERHGWSLAVLVLDLDRFKRINDVHGHQVGDRVLVDFCRRSVAQLRKSDLFARYGGEEFVAVLPDATPDAAVAVAERIRTSVEHAGGDPAYTVSIGVAIQQRGRPDIQELLRAADGALYRAKSNGRNRVEVA